MNTKRTVLITRPQPGADHLATRVAQAGWKPLIEPLLTIVPEKNADMNFNGYGGLIFTSASGVRAVSRADISRDLPVYVVGPATAAAARDSGFIDIRQGGGTVEVLSCFIKNDDRAPRILLHLSGADVAGAVRPPPGIRVDRRVVYRVEAADSLTPMCRDAFAEGQIAAALFFSPRTARIFNSLIRAVGRAEALKSVKALCISDSVVECLHDLPWQTIVCAATPDTGGVLSLLGAVNDNITGTE